MDLIAGQYVGERVWLLANNTAQRLKLAREQRLQILEQSLCRQDRAALLSVSEFERHFQAVLRSNPRHDLLWLACLDVEANLKKEHTARSSVTLFGMRIIAEREAREAQRALRVENFSEGGACAG